MYYNVHVYTTSRAIFSILAKFFSLKVYLAYETEPFYRVDTGRPWTPKHLLGQAVIVKSRYGLSTLGIIHVHR